MKKRRLKITPVLIALNIVLLLTIASFYITRAVHYYLEENGKKVGSDDVLIGDYISKKQSYLDETKGLVYDEEDNIYTYKGDVKDNYLYYSGIMFRIIGIDNENNVRAVADKSVTLMYSGLELGYEKSYIRKWLNINEETANSGIFMNNLYDRENILAHSYVCLDVIDDPSNITCEENTNNDYVTMLTLNDYNLAGGADSFLNNGENFYLGTTTKDGDDYIVTSTGEVSLNSISTRAYGVRPVITINASALLLDGKGTESSPYIIEKHEKKVLADAYVGEYVKVSGNNYKIISLSEDKVLVAGTEAIMKEEALIEIKFGSNNKYSASNTVGKYLNNDFYNSIEEKEYIVKSDWYIGSNSMSNLDYTAAYGSKVSANVGMLSIADMYVHEVKNVFTISRGIEDDDVIEVINSEGNIFGDFVSKKYNVRPAFYLTSDLSITGKGTAQAPYELGGKVNGEETKEEQK